MMRDIYPGIRFRNTDTIRGMLFKLAKERFALAKNSLRIFTTPDPGVKKALYLGYRIFFNSYFASYPRVQASETIFLKTFK